MAVTQYVGARYVPIFADPTEWSSTKQYEPLTIVLHEGNSYTSRQFVPVGVDIQNTDYWAETGNYNAQVESYRQEVLNYVSKEREHVTGVATVADMQVADLSVGQFCITQGFRSVNDGGCALYVISNNGTPNGMDKIQCANGIAHMVNDGNVCIKSLGAYGDGITDDTAIIQYALDTYKNITLSADTFLVQGERGESILNITNSLSLNGCGATIKINPSHALYGTSDTGFLGMFDISADDVCMENLTLYGSADVADELGFVLRDIFASSNPTYVARRNSTYAGVYAHNGIKNLTFRNINITYCRMGFNFARVSHSTIDDCDISYMYADGIMIRDSSNHISVTNCKCYLTQDDVYDAVGFSGQNDDSLKPTNIVYDNCTAENCYGAGFSFEGCAYVIGSNCVFTNMRYTPFKIGSLIRNAYYSVGHDITITNCIFDINNPQASNTAIKALLIMRASDSLSFDSDVKEPYNLITEGCTFNVRNKGANVNYLECRHCNDSVFQNNVVKGISFRWTACDNLIMKENSIVFLQIENSNFIIVTNNIFNLTNGWGFVVYFSDKIYAYNNTYKWSEGPNELTILGANFIPSSEHPITFAEVDRGTFDLNSRQYVSNFFMRGIGVSRKDTLSPELSHVKPCIIRDAVDNRLYTNKTGAWVAL